MSSTNSFRFPKGTDVSLSPFSPPTPTSISGWSLQMNFKLAPSDTTNKLTLDNGSNGGITITDAVNGIFAVAITQAQTNALGVGTFVWDLWRTDSGANDKLAEGVLQLTGSVRFGAT